MKAPFGRRQEVSARGLEPLTFGFGVAQADAENTRKSSSETRFYHPKWAFQTLSRSVTKMRGFAVIARIDPVIYRIAFSGRMPVMLTCREIQAKKWIRERFTPAPLKYFCLPCGFG